METIFDTMKMLKLKGMTFNQAVREWESITHVAMPDHLFMIVRDEWDSYPDYIEMGYLFEGVKV